MRRLVRKIPPFVYRITTDEEKTFSKFWCANKSLIVWKSFLPFVIFLLRMRLSNITSQEKIPQNLFQNIPEEFSLFNIWHFIEFDHKQFKTSKKRRNLKSEAWHARPMGTTLYPSQQYMKPLKLPKICKNVL